jgi:glycosyltransferase involved in cell wall biosynthesis/GT2 family glycosyltransferase
VRIDRHRPPRVSVIISTASRPAHHLRRLLDRLRAQPYRPVEVVLVVGPGPDETRAFAESLADVKVGYTDELNMARSRNLGIAMASGEILAFIDDDAVPGYLWIDELVEAFGREGLDCGGVGGSTIQANAPAGPRMQHRNAIIHELGMPNECLRLEVSDFNAPEGPWFNRLHGCNMAFRREAIEAVGGFDETFVFLHEETDICIRLIRMGYRIVHHPRAVVDHYPASSHNRRDDYDIGYYNMMRSYTYFALKHGRGPWTSVAARIVRDHRRCFGWFVEWALERRISPVRGLKFTGQWLLGYARGLRLGLRRRRAGSAGPAVLSAPADAFRPLRSAPAWEPPRPVGGRALRVALLCAEFGSPSRGGVAAYTEHLAEGLARRGHEVVVFRFGYGPGEVQPVGYRVVGVPPEVDCPLPISTLRRLRAMAQAAPFDVVEAPLWGGEGAIAGATGLAPLVVRLETPLEVIRQVSSLPLSTDLAVSIARERLGLSYAAGVVAISRAIAATVDEVYEARLANHGRLATVLPIGLPGADDVPIDPIEPPDADGFRMLYVGRLEARKGILELGRAFAAMARRVPGARLWIAGADNSGPDGHRGRTGQDYPETLRELWGPELSRRVRFLGRVPEGVKNALLAHCDVFLAPSLYESFGIVFLEAMRLGKPVIGTRVGGVPEIVEHGVTGLLVAPQDPGALAEAMETLASDALARERMGAAGRSRFEAHFTVDEFARRTEAFYREVIDHWQGSRFAWAAADRAEPEASQAA